MIGAPLSRHQADIERNLDAWRSKPLLREIYAAFYRRILEMLDLGLPGPILEIGSGIGSFKAHLPSAITTDMFPNPWLDVACDAYELPFKDRTVSHLVLVDVFHHLQAPDAFLREARRVLVDEGRLILLEPYVSWFSLPVYGLMHHEPVAWRDAISFAERPPDPHDYYAAQGNTTRLFFRRVRPGWPDGWSVFHAEALAGVSYLLSGGFSRRALYPARWLPWLQRCDARLSRWPRAFGARCLIGLRPEGCRRRATPGVTARS